MAERAPDSPRSDLAGLIERHRRRTFTPRVLGDDPAHAGCIRLDFVEKLFRRNYRDPVLVSAAGGAGDKLPLAAALGVLDLVGRDCVAGTVNDLVSRGAEPLFFLHRLALHGADPQLAPPLIEGLAEGCVQGGCAWLGGETTPAPAPGVSPASDGHRLDLAGFSVGACELGRLIDGRMIDAGDAVLGLASSGVHAGGFAPAQALARQANLDLNRVYPELDPGRCLGAVLLTPTRPYARQVVKVLRRYRVKQVVTGMLHVAAAGLPAGLTALVGADRHLRLQPGRRPVPPVFGFLQQHGGLSDAQMGARFNMGMGFVLVVRPAFADSILAQFRRQRQPAWVIGTVVKGPGGSGDEV
jgi:phosphoribosylformylglycinamidine cyclo-ligase